MKQEKRTTSSAEPRRQWRKRQKNVSSNIVSWVKMQIIGSRLTVSRSKHRCSLSMLNSPGVIGGSGDRQDSGVLLASGLRRQRDEDKT